MVYGTLWELHYQLGSNEKEVSREIPGLFPFNRCQTQSVHNDLERRRAIGRLHGKI